MELIKNYNLNELKNIIKSFGFEQYRAEQIYRYIFINRLTDFFSMNLIPAKLRELLNSEFQLSSFINYLSSYSKDGTIKFLFVLKDGFKIETVLIPENDSNDSGKKRITLCISTQIGCNYDCEFCATGKLRFVRNLNVSEIIDQLFFAEQISGKKITNIVFMGMGEPLLNYENLTKSISMLTDEKYKIIGSQRITVSTVGIVPQILQLCEFKPKVKLALSLHFTNDNQRKTYIPAAKKWNLDSITEAIRYYYYITKIPVTIEYIVFNSINTTNADVDFLFKLSKSIAMKVNLIQYNSINIVSNKTDRKLEKASEKEILEFQKKLVNNGIKTFIRHSSGSDIDAACGQLALKYK